MIAKTFGILGSKALLIAIKDDILTIYELLKS